MVHIVDLQHCCCSYTIVKLEYKEKRHAVVMKILTRIGPGSDRINGSSVDGTCDKNVN